jgi:predicted ribosomally synthesized peptide with nif11-like leader
MAFAERLETDLALCRKLEQLDTANRQAALDEVSRIARAAGFSFTPSELEAALSQLTAATELGNLELDQVRGGAASTGSLDSQSTEAASTRKFIQLLGIPLKP